MDQDNDQPTARNVDLRQPAVGIHSRKSKWWLIPLILLLLLLGLLGFWALNDEMNGTADQTSTDSSRLPSNQSSQSGNGDQPITRLSTLLAADTDDLASSRAVDLRQVTVVKVAGDRAFTIGNENNYRYALLSGALNAGQAENRVQVEAGQTVEIVGTVVRVTEDTKQLRSDYELSAEQAQKLAADGYYVLVESIDIQ